MITSASEHHVYAAALNPNTQPRGREADVSVTSDKQTLAEKYKEGHER